MLHIVEDELGACLAADRGVAGRKEFERHRSERTAAGRKARFQWVWAQRISPAPQSSGLGDHGDACQHLLQLTWALRFDQSRRRSSTLDVTNAGWPRGPCERHFRSCV